MRRVWEYIYWRLPVGKRQFLDKANDLVKKADSLRQILESGIKNSYNHQNELYNQMSGKIDGLSNEVRHLHEENARLERIITHYHKQDMQMFWEEYRKDGESTADAQKRFFLALPKAKGVSRNLQLLEKDLLRAFARICEENQLSYWLYAGTLLGAVRHKGFIPWDDDIDVTMPAPDYIKLGELLSSDMDFLWNSTFNDKLENLPFSTLSKLESKKIFTECRFFPVRAWSGMGIDIFPICGYPKDVEEQIEFRNEFMYWENVWSEKVVIPYGTEQYSKSTQKRLFDKMNELLMRYDYDTATTIGVGYFGRFTPKPVDGTMTMPSEWYKQYVMMEFEGEKYRCPVGYDQSLRKWYGDYLQLPPIEEQIPHGSYKIYEVDSNN